MSSSNTLHSLEQPSDKQWTGPSLNPRQRLRTALWFLIAVLSVLFGLFAVAYRMRMMLGDWIALDDPWQLWINTTMLVLSSIAFELARRSSTQGNPQRFRLCWVIGMLSSIGFIIGQLWVWQFLVTQGYYLASNPANSFFYLLTGLHGVHLLIGLLIWLRTLPAIINLRLDQQANNWINLCSLYWHYLLLVWIAIFALLSSS
jgi:cytochrome c oxidase subunit III